MLSSMRNNAGSLIIKILFGVIIIVFVLWGVGTNQSDRANRVAVVNGQPISIEAYEREYQNLLDRIRAQFGGELNAEMVRLLNPKGQAVRKLVDESVIVDEAENMGMIVGTEELAEAIRSIPAFQLNGVFNAEQYNRVLASNRMTPESFEIATRQELLIRKLSRFISEGAKVSDGEAREWFNWQNATVNVEYIVFSPDDYEVETVPEEEMTAYFESNQNDYNTQPMVKARYLVFSVDDYRSGITVSKEEIDEYYEENLDAFKKPESVQARHILFKVDEDADESTVSSVRKKAEDIYLKVIDGQDFAEMAKTYSEGPTRETGGFLGTFERGTMVQPFEEKAFSMAPGDVSEPVRTPFGWHIIKVEEKRPETTLSVEDADPQIRGILSDRKAKLAAYEDALAAYDATYDSDDFPMIASSVGKSLQETDFFDRVGPSGVGDADRFAAIAFDLEDGGYSEVEELSGNYYLLQLMERKPSEVPPFDTVRDRVVQDVLARKKKEKAESEARRYLEMISSGKTLGEAASAAGKDLIETGFFGRRDPVPAIGTEPAFSDAAFGLSESNPLFDDIVQGQNNVFLIHLIDRRKPEAADFENDSEDVKRQLLNQKQATVFRSWLDDARQRSDIVIEAAFQE